MTQNQLRYAELLHQKDVLAETKRSNQMKERQQDQVIAETARSNLARESETVRTNLANEAINTFKARSDATIRSDANIETATHNRNMELIQTWYNQGQMDYWQAQSEVSKRNASVNEYNATTQRADQITKALNESTRIDMERAKIEAQVKLHNAQTVKTYADTVYGAINAGTNVTNAMSGVLRSVLSGAGAITKAIGG